MSDEYAEDDKLIEQMLAKALPLFDKNTGQWYWCPDLHLEIPFALFDMMEEAGVPQSFHVVTNSFDFATEQAALDGLKAAAERFKQKRYQ